MRCPRREICAGSAPSARFHDDHVDLERALLRHLDGERDRATPPVPEPGEGS